MTDTPSDRFIRKPELLADLGIHDTTLWEWVKQQRFPEPVVLNPGARREIVAWRERDIREGKDSRPQRLAQPITEAAYEKARRKRKLRRPTK
jgi:predicted DNA-binding transcriptional regulator AlpA